MMSFPALGISEEREETIVVPVSSIGKVSESRRMILKKTHWKNI